MHRSAQRSTRRSARNDQNASGAHGQAAPEEDESGMILTRYDVVTQARSRVLFAVPPHGMHLSGPLGRSSLMHPALYR